LILTLTTSRWHDSLALKPCLFGSPSTSSVRLSSSPPTLPRPDDSSSPNAFFPRASTLVFKAKGPRLTKPHCTKRPKTKHNRTKKPHTKINKKSSIQFNTILSQSIIPPSSPHIYLPRFLSITLSRCNLFFKCFSKSSTMLSGSVV
jgi:hypothetical protein